ncbi:LysR family transcriptional regulator [Shewanella eurypsychrophilus]|uniref:LysR family transcriptional regulator n=1 Tax=Shewanella eurypsychrophilus TaxID=2593656 RepID=A0ABX6V8S9_9GAMM|nr:MULTISPECIES: LysR substrate-binding domain-containing protein [Shewanella]QFU23614.1 LysR family transcriptional regulator [Shewanella sp. YLB-09]QPG58837.1 LysR family transcriptional regulator [Shewanella eurypsychrophilus]
MDPNTLERHLVSRLKFKYLRLLVTVGEQQNIFRAAQLLNMAQPAATKIIRDIENALDLRLFDRSSRGVVPTMYGDVLIKHAKLVLSQVKHASEELSTLQGGLSGRVTVGTLLAASATLLPKAIARLKKERPNVSIVIVEGTADKLMSALKIDDIDIMVGRISEFSDEEQLTNEVLYKDPVSLVSRADHPLQSKTDLSLKDLLKYEWILPPRETLLRKEIDDIFHREGLNVPANAVESVSILVNRTLLKETDMISTLPDQVIKTYAEIGLLKKLPIDLGTESGLIGITTRANRELPPVCQSLLEALREEAELIKQG